MKDNNIIPIHLPRYDFKRGYSEIDEELIQELEELKILIKNAKYFHIRINNNVNRNITDIYSMKTLVDYFN